MGDDGRVCMKLFKNGKLYVTTIRMVFVASNPDVNSDFCSFDIPLSNVRGEQFNQPIFGCNNLSGTCLPLPGFSGSINWTIAFKSGGVGRLLSVLQDLLVRNRTGRPEAPEGESILVFVTIFLPKFASITPSFQESIGTLVRSYCYHIWPPDLCCSFLNVISCFFHC